MSDDGDRSKTSALHKNARARARCNPWLRASEEPREIGDALIARRRFGRILKAALWLALVDEADVFVRESLGWEKSRAARRTLAGFEVRRSQPLLHQCFRGAARNFKASAVPVFAGSGALRSQILRIVRTTDSIVDS